MTYRIAEKNIEMISVHNDVHRLCTDYRTDGVPDFKVETTQSDIEHEREKYISEARAEGKPILDYSDGYLETLAVYRKIAEKMLDCDTLLFHGSVIAVDGEGYLFTAKSGTGKSTHTRLWREYFGERAVMVNDDKPLLRVTENGVFACGTPWDGKHRLSSNISVPLKGICILQRSSENYVEKISRQTAYPMLLQQSYRPENGAGLSRGLRLIDRISEKTALYRLGCNMDISAAETAYNGMKGK